MERCGCGKKTLFNSLDICRKCVIHNVEIHDVKTFVTHWLCSSTILDPENVRRIFHRGSVGKQNMPIDNAICAKCGYSMLATGLSGDYCKLGKVKPIKYCRHFFDPNEM